MAVSLQQLTKTYGDQHAIHNLSFDVPKGEILGFLGPNGAGKTTTMKILTCFMPPNSGAAQVAGFDISTHPQEVRKRVGYLPEHNPLYLDMYVHEFLEFTAQVYQLDKKTWQRRIPELIDMTGLGLEQHKKIGMLSKGYRQRVGLSQALMHDPEVLILDEPTTGLDPNQIVDIRELIREVGKEKTVIFSSHILSEVEAIANRIIIINKGEIVADSEGQDLQQMVGGTHQLHLEFATSGFDFSTIKTLTSVTEIQSTGPNTFRVILSGSEDIRQQIFQEVVAQEHILLGMQQEKFSLEDIFRKLTESTTA
ncbi:MAG: gliding motility-associated ABC transporter ATP-binding subunit GldA [Bacteroidota bacterium]